MRAKPAPPLAPPFLSSLTHTLSPLTRRAPHHRIVQRAARRVRRVGPRRPRHRGARADAARPACGRQNSAHLADRPRAPSGLPCGPESASVRVLPVEADVAELSARASSSTLRRVGVRPNGGTYAALIDACARAGDLNNAMAALQASRPAHAQHMPSHAPTRTLVPSHPHAHMHSCSGPSSCSTFLLVLTCARPVRVSLRWRLARCRRCSWWGSAPTPRPSRR